MIGILVGVLTHLFADDTSGFVLIGIFVGVPTHLFADDASGFVLIGIFVGVLTHLFADDASGGAVADVGATLGDAGLFAAYLGEGGHAGADLLRGGQRETQAQV